MLNKVPQERAMTEMVKAGVDKAPLILGGGILALALVGSVGALAGYSLGFSGEVAAALIGMVLAARYV